MIICAPKNPNLSSEQVKSSSQVQLPSVPNRFNPVNASPHVTSDPVQTGSPLKHATAPVEAGDDVTWPPRRPMPPMPEGEITQRVGEEFCKRICNMYPEVFNNEKGNFLGANATMILKPGGLEKKNNPALDLQQKSRMVSRHNLKNI